VHSLHIKKPQGTSFIKWFCHKSYPVSRRIIKKDPEGYSNGWPRLSKDKLTANAAIKRINQILCQSNKTKNRALSLYLSLSFSFSLLLFLITSPQFDCQLKTVGMPDTHWMAGRQLLSGSICLPEWQRADDKRQLLADSDRRRMMSLEQEQLEQLQLGVGSTQKGASFYKLIARPVETNCCIYPSKGLNWIVGNLFSATRENGSGRMI